jgi:hypothetical protein
MKTNYLLPHSFKQVGWLLLITGLLFGLYYIIFDSEPEWLRFQVFAFFDDQVFGGKVQFKLVENIILDELVVGLLILGATFVAFSKEKIEDEFVEQIRLEALVWSVYINYSILLISLIFVFGMPFFWVMSFNMFTILILFVILFKWRIYQSKKTLAYEE